MQTIQEKLAELRAENPGRTFKGNRKGNAIAVMIDSTGDYFPAVSMCIDNKWRGLPGNIIVNGDPLFDQSQWVEDTEIGSGYHAR